MLGIPESKTKTTRIKVVFNTTFNFSQHVNQVNSIERKVNGRN